MLQKKGLNTFTCLILLNIICCICFFYPILGHLNTIMMADGGDGIKNYFTYLYFIKYDAGTHFTGMNYPFGENIVFSDNTPALAWTIVKIRTWFPGIVNYSLVIMHSTFLLSYFLCSIFTYKILKLFNVKGWWLVASAIFITYFSPQFSRLFGHFSLCYTCFFPMMIYWIMQFERYRKWQYPLYIGGLVLLFSFVHVYYLGFSCVLLLAYCLAYWIAHRTNVARKIKFSMALLLPLVFAILGFRLYQKFTDPVTDRPIYPIGGFTGNVAQLFDILTSRFNFIGRYSFSWLLGGEVSGDREGYAYIGFTSILVLLFLVFRILRSLFLKIGRKIKAPIHPVRAYRKWLLVALLSLLFSMGVPFIWGMEFLADYFSLFRQFRTLGRFSWIFYYVMMIYAAVVIFRLLIRMHRKGLKLPSLVIPVLIVGVWIIEWNGYGQVARETSMRAKDNYNRFYLPANISWPVWLAEKGYDAGYFQGTIGLPYMHIGSEKVGAGEDYGTIMYYGGQIGYFTGLKMVDIMMSRTSKSQSLENVRLCDGPFSPKPIISRFNNKPFLVFVAHNFPPAPGEEALVKYAKHIGNKSGLDLYELNIQEMQKRDIRYTDSISTLVNTITKTEGLLHNDSAFVYVNHFDKADYAQPFAGNGAYKATSEKMQLLVTIPVTHLTTDSMFNFSTWFLCYPQLPEMPYMIYKQYDKDNNLIYEGDYLASRSYYEINDWYKAERVVCIKPQTTKMELYVAGGTKNYLALDEILIAPVNSIYFYKLNDSLLMLNNRPIKKK